MTVLTRPVSISQIRSALGAASNATLSQLCTHANVNKWSKYKPIKYAANGIMSQYDYTNERWKTTSDWWKGHNGTCGFTAYTTTSFANVRSNTAGGMNGWTYNGTPTGGTYPYRQVDFIGYNHEAPAPASGFVGTTQIKNQGHFSASFDLEGGEDDNVTIRDIYSSNLYFGVAICNSSGNVVFHGTSSTAWDGNISFTLSGISTGNYSVVPFFCTQTITPQTGGFSQQYTFVTIPYLSSYTLSVVASMANLNVYGQWNNTQKTSLTVTVDNEDAEYYSGAIYVRYTNHNWQDPETTTEPNSNISLSSHGSVTRTFNNLSSSHQYRVQVRLTNGDLFEADIDEPME